MGNVLTNLFQTKVVPGLYRQYFSGLTSGWMENNAAGVIYNGGKYVIMHEMEIGGLGDYDRELGYPRGAITGSKKQYELTKDRGREFLIDAADNDETGFLVNGQNVMLQFQQEHVIPEVDSYRYSKIYSDMAASDYAANIIATAIDEDLIVETLADDVATIRDNVGINIPLVIIMSGLTQKYLGREFTHSLDYANFSIGGLSTKVKTLDGDPLMIVPSARLKTAYTFYDGTSAGETDGGFTAAVGAADMKWIVTPITGPAAVGKIDKMRAFSPDEYQMAHAWKVDYRLYHDLWMFDKTMQSTIIRTGAIS